MGIDLIKKHPPNKMTVPTLLASIP